MKPVKAFTVGDIEGASLSIPISLSENSAVDNLMKSVVAGNFKTTKAYSGSLIESLDRVVARVTFSGVGFAFGISKTKFSAQFLKPFEFVELNATEQMGNEEASKIFTEENLNQISSDFNYILGLIFGKLNLDSKNYELNFNIDLSKQIDDLTDLSHILTSESKIIFGNAKEFQLHSISISMNEEMFESNTKAKYRLGENRGMANNEHSRMAGGRFSFKHSGPIDFSKLVNESIVKLNALITNLMEV